MQGSTTKITFLSLVGFCKDLACMNLCRFATKGGWDHTLHLPKPLIPLRPSKDTSPFLARLQVYNSQVLNTLNSNAKEFIIADGPPFANGSLHIGHAFNKILKDTIARFKLLQGYKVRYEKTSCIFLSLDCNLLGIVMDCQ